MDRRSPIADRSDFLLRSSIRYPRSETMVAQAENGWKDGWYIAPYRVMFGDVDTFGHVNNAVYFTYFEHARTLLWFELTGGSSSRDVNFIVARAECDFRQQLGMEPIDICVRIGEMRSTSFDFVYEIRKTGGGQIAAVGKVVVVLFNWQKQSKVTISDELRRKVMSLQKTET